MEILSRTRANDVQFVQRAGLRVLGCDVMQSLVAVGVWGYLTAILEKWCWTTSGQLFGVLDKIWTNFRGFWTNFCGFGQKYYIIEETRLKVLCEICTMWVLGRDLGVAFQVYLWYTRTTELRKRS